MKQTIHTSCYDLVTAIEEKLGRSLTAPVREAFLRVPRHLFVQRYYERQRIQTAPESSKGSAWEQWCSTIYHDQALTTQVDRRGMPTSSSSQPSVMASMIEQLDIKPGMRILEIGTGTGYNAALLSLLVGAPHLVTTIDLDPTLVQLALPRIEQVVGTGMTICVGNGLEGYQPDAPYERIIATGSFLPVPWAWLEQLAPEGKLVMDLRGRIAGGLTLITKHSDGTATGQFFTSERNISFMGLRSSLEMLASSALPGGYQQFPVQELIQLDADDPVYHCAAHFSTYEQFCGEDQAVNIWLQWQFPGLSIRWKSIAGRPSTVLIDNPTQTVLTIEKQEQGMEITVHGIRPLWSEILHAYQDWLIAERPERDVYTFSLDQQGQQSMNMQQISRSFLLAQSQGCATSFQQPQKTPCGW